MVRRVFYFVGVGLAFLRNLYFLSTNTLLNSQLFMTKDYIIEQFKELSFPTKGFEGWLSDSAPEAVFNRFKRLDREPLTKVQLNQLLLLSLESGISDGFFKYYWLAVPDHSYAIDKLDDFDNAYITTTAIVSIEQLRWGIRRIYTDCLLYFGNISYGFKELKNKTFEELCQFFKSKCFPTEIIKKRGRPLEFHDISKDDRYLISEMACKSYGETPKTKTELLDFLKESFIEAKANGYTNPSFKDLLSSREGSKAFVNAKSREKYQNSILMFEFSVDELLDVSIADEADLEEKYGRVADKFLSARENAAKNTDLYLSLVNDLDVYVATSMRNRKDFREMADTCEKIFKDVRLRDMYLRYFDPTMSAADGHEDKGLIECLMVKCAKALIYTEGDKESYGKDAEAAMALSLGKPVIFLSPKRANFYRTVHPLTRLIDFNTGVAVGAIITDKPEQVAEILHRVFENKMEYLLEQSKPGYFKLKEKLTQSVVRLQTNNKLLSKCFWAYYHNKHEVGS